MAASSPTALTSASGSAPLSPARSSQKTRSLFEGDADVVPTIAELYRRYGAAIYAHCRRLLGSPTLARDAVQESFVRVLQHQRNLGPGEQALRYLYRTSTNVCINQLRQRAVRDKAAPEIAARAAEREAAESVGDRQFARLLLERCDDRSAEIAIMHYIDGMTQVEVAATLGITRRTVFNRLRRIEALAASLLGARVEAEPKAQTSP
jgi:RNA polymerase sigma-70 factor (ECF subfamily)